jgi:hypothetical protein
LFLFSQLWYLAPTGRRNKLVVAIALSSNDVEWKHRDGQLVRLPDTPGLRESWPTKRILQVQQKFFEQKKAERHEERLVKPYPCPSCATDFASNRQAFNTHVKNCTARTMPAQFFAPQKGNATARKKK